MAPLEPTNALGDAKANRQYELTDGSGQGSAYIGKLFSGYQSLPSKQAAIITTIAMMGCVGASWGREDFTHASRLM